MDSSANTTATASTAVPTGLTTAEVDVNAVTNAQSTGFVADLVTPDIVQSLTDAFKSTLSEWGSIPLDQLANPRTHGNSILRSGGARPVPSSKVVAKSDRPLNSTKRIGTQTPGIIRLRPSDDDLGAEVVDVVQYDIPEKPKWSQEADSFLQMVEQKRAADLPLPSSKMLFAYFKTLRLVDNQIGHIDAASKEFSNLTELCLNMNALKHIDANHLPVSIEIFNIYGNMISQVPDLSVLPKLVHLGIGFNRIQTLPLSLGDRLRSLLSLDLSYNEIDDLQAALDAISSITKLRHLVLVGNPCSFAPEYRGFTIDTIPWISVLDDVVVTEKERDKYSGDRNKDLTKTINLTVEILHVKKLREPKAPAKPAVVAFPGAAVEDPNESRVYMIHGEIALSGLPVQKTPPKQFSSDKLNLDFRHTFQIPIDKSLTDGLKNGIRVRFFETIMIQRPVSSLSKKEKKPGEKQVKTPSKGEEKPPPNAKAAVASKEKEKAEKGKDLKVGVKKEVKVKIDTEEPPQSPSPIQPETGEDLVSVTEIGWAHIPLDDFLDPTVSVLDNQYCIEYNSLEDYENLIDSLSKERAKQANDARLKLAKSKREDGFSVVTATNRGKGVSKYQPTLRLRALMSCNAQASLPNPDYAEPY